jgi:hypothetical protein
MSKIRIYTMELEFLFEIYEKHGIMGFVSVAIGVAILFITWETSKKVASIMKNKIKVGEIFIFGKRIKYTRKRLKNHFFFEKYEHLIKHRIPQMNIKCPLRKKILSYILNVKLTAYRDNIKKLVDDPDIERYTEQHLQQEIDSVLNDSETYWKNKVIAVGIPQEVVDNLYVEIEQIKKLERKYVSNICFSPASEESNVEKLATVMSFMWSMEEYIVRELEKVLDNMNGTISNIKTKDFNCFECENCKAHFKKKK